MKEKEILIIEFYYHEKLKNKFIFDAECVYNPKTPTKYNTQALEATIKNFLIDLFRAEYRITYTSPSNIATAKTMKLWDIKTSITTSNQKNIEKLDIDKLLDDIEDSFIDTSTNEYELDRERIEAMAKDARDWARRTKEFEMQKAQQK